MTLEYTVNNVPIEIEMLNPNSRVWIFPATRNLNSAELMQSNEQLRQFCEQWTVHNQQVRAEAAIFYNRFVVVMLDEEASTAASGCSMDALNRHIQNIGDTLDVNFLEREIFHFLIDGNVVNISMNDLPKRYQDGQINDNTLVFNNLINNKEGLYDKWLVPLHKSWHYRFVR